jgi:hypothetical protein
VKRVTVSVSLTAIIANRFQTTGEITINIGIEKCKPIKPDKTGLCTNLDSSNNMSFEVKR